MASAFTHALVGLAAAYAGGLPPRRLALLAAVYAVLPDADAFGFQHGVPYGSFLGHRGFTHSLVFALVTGFVVTTLAFRDLDPKRLAYWSRVLFFAVVTASHGVLDALTNGGLGTPCGGARRAARGPQVGAGNERWPARLLGVGHGTPRKEGDGATNDPRSVGPAMLLYPDEGDEVVSSNSVLEVVVLVGIPASGKSTFYRTRFAATHVHISKDLFPNARHRDRRQAQLIDEALGAGRPVVVDNTSPTAAERAVIIEAARRHGARVVGYYFATPLAHALVRNAARQGRARVPDVGVRSVAKRLCRPHPDEGYDKLYFVRLVEADFAIEPWREPRDEAGRA